METQATDSVLSLKGVGTKTATLFQTLGIESVSDLWFHLPYRYQDRTHYTPFTALISGNHALVKGRVLKTEIKFGRRRSLVVWVEADDDDLGMLGLRFFYFSQAQKNMYQPGELLECYGEPRMGAQGFEMVHPEVNILGKSSKTLLNDMLTPVYPSTKGLNQPLVRKCVEQSLTTLDGVSELLPLSLLAEFGFGSLAECLSVAHTPSTKLGFDKVQKAREYLVFEELAAHYFALKKIKRARQKEQGFPIQIADTLQQQCIAALPFSLTKAQMRVTSEIVSDMQHTYPMQRLLQGDVGSGKTLVAVLAALACVEAGYQVALMVPTELLAKQHYQNISDLVAHLPVKICLLTGSVSAPERRQIEDDIKTGVARLVVGTHALFQKNVTFDDLALVIIDEQHRFGVEQRLALTQKAKGGVPHLLVMTATPIPRTLAMSFYAFLEYSVIDELPPGRTPVQTSSLPESKRDEVIGRLKDYGAAGKQAYWVCPLIEESEVLQCQTATQTYDNLSQQLPNLNVGLVHGQMKATEKDQVMRDFKDHKLDILVATTVIEVGVDVPNASLMMIDNAERLGLSQLHQLRGRVGRGAEKSSCVLLYKSPLSMNAKSRLDMMRKSNDGFEIAQRDLELRGPGELLGKAQTGEIKFKLADFARDHAMLQKVAIMGETLDKVCDKACEEKLIARWKIKSQAVA